MEPVFSVIVPVYRVERYIRKCIESILQQTFFDFELILVDDGSDDACPQICDAYAARDTRVRVIHKKNEGLSGARETGILASRGRYIGYVDGDDWVTLDWLEKVYRHIAEYDPDIVVFRVKTIYSDREEDLQMYEPEGYYTKERLEQEIFPVMLYDPKLPFFTSRIYPSSCNKVYKRELLLAHYCRDTRITQGEDDAYTFECMYYADSVYFSREIFYCYNRCNEESMTRKYNAQYFRNCERLCAYLQLRLGEKDEQIAEQIKVFKFAWMIMGVFHEVDGNPARKEAMGNICVHLKKNRDAFRDIELPLPLHAKIFLALTQCGAYPLIYILTKAMRKLRG